MFLPPHKGPWRVPRIRKARRAEMPPYVPLIVRRALRSPADRSPLACWIRALAQQVERANALSPSTEQLLRLVAQRVSRRVEQWKGESASAAMQDTVHA
jgi:hypothetical protein